MDLDKAGGAAFPLQFNVVGPACDPITGKQVSAGHTNAHVFVGMTLRDYFAAQALPAILAQDGDGVSERAPSHKMADGTPYVQWWAKCAYELADAMLAERAK